MGYFNQRPEKNLFTDTILKWIIDIVVVIIFAYFLLQFYGQKITVSGNSMSDELRDGQVVLADTLSYKLSNPDRFDVIIYKSPLDKEQYIIKRIIGLPGEKIRISEGKIYINGKEIKDSYFKGNYESGYVSEETVISEDEYFVMGDNRNLSEDSRFLYVGNIKKDDILGKAYLKVAPFKDAGFVE